MAAHTPSAPGAVTRAWTPVEARGKVTLAILSRSLKAICADLGKEVPNHAIEAAAGKLGGAWQAGTTSHGNAEHDPGPDVRPAVPPV